MTAPNPSRPAPGSTDSHRPRRERDHRQRNQPHSDRGRDPDEQINLNEFARILGYSGPDPGTTDFARRPGAENRGLQHGRDAGQARAPWYAAWPTDD